MALNDMAKDLTALCRACRFLEAVQKHYSPHVVCVEAVGSAGMDQETRGLDAVEAKCAAWHQANALHAVVVEGPFIGEDQFALHFTFDVTHRPSGRRVINTEMALYTVNDGKIVRARFFYNVPRG